MVEREAFRTVVAVVASAWFCLATMQTGNAQIISSRTVIADNARSAGDFTLAIFDEKAFSEPAKVLSFNERKTFDRGRAHFHRKWVQFPSLAGDWGLGPTFIADRCSACHKNVGRGTMPADSNKQLADALVRIRLAGQDEHGRPEAHPAYGLQIQNQGLMGQDRDATFLGERVRPEAEVFVEWSQHEVVFPDGEKVSLRKPTVRWGKMFFGPLGDGVQQSLRIAQQLVGLGLLEAVPVATLERIAKEQKQQGFNGRLNYVWDDISQTKSVGRFGWKANQPSIAQQIAAAFAEDLGVTSRLYPDINCPGPQADCAAQPPGNQPELINLDWEQLIFWTRTLGVPAKRDVEDPDFARGETLFAKAQCAVCHRPALKTADEFPDLPQLAGQTIHAYTDMLIHDMGTGLADSMYDFDARPSDWRTPPLWGIGLTRVTAGDVALLHDGRARNLTEAILWHGGEAAGSRDAFLQMPKADREALLKFLRSI